MSDIFSLIDEEVDAQKFDKVSTEKGSMLSTLVRQSMEIEDDIAATEQQLKDLKYRNVMRLLLGYVPSAKVTLSRMM